MTVIMLSTITIRFIFIRKNETFTSIQNKHDILDSFLHFINSISELQFVRNIYNIQESTLYATLSENANH